VNLDLERRKTIYTELQKTLIEKAPALFLYVPYETQVLQRAIKGFRIVGNGAIYYLEEVTVER
jgi:ABC-type transport system substrate-binding protein